VAQFQTLSVDLAPIGRRALAHFRARGYAVRLETKPELGFPYAPTLSCRREQTMMIVEVVEKIDRGRIAEWLAYGRSAGRDFRVGVLITETGEQSLTAEDRNWLAGAGVGLYVAGPAAIHERTPSRDLAFNPALPDLGGASAEVRRRLAPAFEQIAGPDWRDGFRSACECLENLARNYLRRGIRDGRVQIMSGGTIRNPSARKVNRMTMGQLGLAFSRIQSQNHLDAQLAEGLRRINPDRVRATHRRLHAVTERNLRANVGRHVHTIFQLVRQLV